MTFAGWLDATLDALERGADVDVPCGECTACCRSSYFIHIEPDESAALRRIPSRLLFPAPGLPKGHVLLGYDEHGRCPMLVDDRCSIYDDRPRTCRSFDCRVYVAAGIDPADDDKLRIAERVREWTFVDADGREHRAVRAAASFLREHGEAPRSGSDLAVAAMKAHRHFLDDATPTIDEVRVAIRRR